MADGGQDSQQEIVVPVEQLRQVSGATRCRCPGRPFGVRAILGTAHKDCNGRHCSVRCGPRGSCFRGTGWDFPALQAAGSLRRGKSLCERVCKLLTLARATQPQHLVGLRTACARALWWILAWRLQLCVLLPQHAGRLSLPQQHSQHRAASQLLSCCTPKVLPAQRQRPPRHAACWGPAARGTGSALRMGAFLLRNSRLDSSG
jgi:hypothetical protein